MEYSSKSCKVPIPAQTSESKAMLSEQDLSSDAPQLRLQCLIEGEFSIFTIEVPADLLPHFVKKLVFKRVLSKGINTDRAISAKDLSLLKVSRSLESSTLQLTFYASSGKCRSRTS
jgi:hypothetical protein